MDIKLRECLEKLKMHETAEVFLGGGSWLWRIPQGVIEVSKGWRKVHGTSQSSFTMEQLMPIAFPEDSTLIDAAFSASMEKGVPYHLTHRIIRQDNGEVKIIKSYAEVVERNKTGDPIKMMGMVQDITELKQAEEELKFLATHDELTGLPTRVLLRDRISYAVELTHRQSHSAAVMFIDLDGFKAVNDKYGHHIGDLLLKELSKRLLSSVRGIDTVSRVGGDEFAVLLSEIANREDACQIAKKLLSLIQKRFHLNGHSIQLSASIGIALCHDDSSSPEDLLEQADAAMYKIKSNGKDGVGFAQ